MSWHFDHSKEQAVGGLDLLKRVANHISLRVAFLIWVTLSAPLAWSASTKVEPIDEKGIRFFSLPSQYGLDRIVTSIIQGPEGFMWFGTQNGLYKYDGASVENVSQRPNAPPQLTFSLYLDVHDALWIGTQTGASKYDYRSQSFFHIVFPHEVQPRVFDFAERGGLLYLATSEGLYVLEGDGLEVSLLHKLNGGIARSIVVDEDNRLWVGTERGGLFVEDADGFSPLLKLRDVLSIRELLIDSENVLWIATFNDGLLAMNMRDKELMLFDKRQSEVGGRVRALVEDIDGNVWVGSDKGLHLWRREDKIFDHFYSGVGRGVSLKEGIIYDLSMDASGAIWVATFSGLTRFNTRHNMIKHISLDRLDSDATVVSFAERDDWIVAIGTAKGVVIWDPLSGDMYDLFDLNHEFRGFVTALEWGVDRSLWIGTYGTGLFLYRQSKLYGPFDEKNQLEKHGVTDIHIDHRNNIWIATAGAGIFRYDDSNRSFEQFPSSKNLQGRFPGLRCLSISEDDKGYFWIDTNDAGPFRFDPISGSTVDYSLGLEKLASNILLDDLGIWMGAYTGEIHLLENDQKKAVRVLTDYKSKLQAVLGLEQIGQFLVVAGQGVLLFYDKDSSDVKFLDSRNGVMADVNLGANLLLTSGQVLFGGTDGINAIAEENITSSYQFAPNVKISSLKVNHQQKEYELGASLNLSYQQNDLDIGYVVTDYFIPTKVLSSYKLEGFDKDWIENGNKRSLTYTNLDPGSYVLRVKGTNSDGVWSPNELVLPIHISPPWWATWWAYTLYVTVALFAFYQLLQLSARRVSVQAEERFNQRLRHYVSALDDASECVLNAKGSGRILYVNDAVREVLGKTVSEVIGHSLFDVLFESDSLKQDALRMLEVEGYYLEEVASRVNQDEKVLEVSIRKSEERADDEVVFVCVVRDVTERSRKATDLKSQVVILHEDIQRITGRLEEAVKASEAYQTEAEARIARDEGLLKSFHDRINDNFQMLSSLFSLQASKTVDVPVVRVLDEVQQRVKTVALVHEQLLQTEEMGRVAMSDYLDVLVTSLYRHLAPRHIQLDLTKDISDFFMSIDQAVPSGLIVNELVTNALVHAYSARTHGSGQLRVSSYELAGECVLLVSDDGQGLPSDFQFEKGSGVGFEIVSILTKQLGGSFKLVGGIGTTFEVRFPIVPVT